MSQATDLSLDIGGDEAVTSHPSPEAPVLDDVPGGVGHYLPSCRLASCSRWNAAKIAPVEIAIWSNAYGQSEWKHSAARCGELR
jgi:hypothetical protein